jgi:DNA-3-methyladenine glycosylase I
MQLRDKLDGNSTKSLFVFQIYWLHGYTSFYINTYAAGMAVNMDKRIMRCPWGDGGDALMRGYHDTQWGKPCFDERTLFEMLNLEGAQAGLSWSTVLHKRDNYASAFDGWDINKIAAYDGAKVAELLQNSGIIRNRLKVNAAIVNAQTVLKLGSLRDFIWNYVDGEPVINHWLTQDEVPATTPLSDRISGDMKKLGFKFVGSTIIYSYLQAIGAVNDHIEDCAFKYHSL